MSLKQVNLMHVFIIGPLLYYIGINQQNTNKIAYQLLGGLVLLIPFIVRFPNFKNLDQRNLINAFHWLILISMFSYISYSGNQTDIRLYPILKYIGIGVALIHILLYTGYIKTNHNHNKKHPLNNWEHKDSMNAYQEVVDEYGKPDILVNQKGGLVIWHDRKPYVRIELKDESVKHCVPANHSDFLYNYIKIYIPPEKIMNVMKISGSISYDPLKKEIFARCGGLAANYATLRTVADVVESKKTNYEVSDNEYKTNIVNRKQELSSNKKRIINFVKRNYKKYKKELEYEYYPLAFPKGCSN